MKVLIVEDEIMAQRSLIRLLAQHFPEMDVIGTTSSVKETAFALGYMLPVIGVHWGLSPVRTCPCWAY